jgi:hypothetical protein
MLTELPVSAEKPGIPVRGIIAGEGVVRHA